MDRRLLELAIEALERQKTGIEADIEVIQAELRGTGSAVRNLPSAVNRRSRPRTQAERKAQSQRMREYWAKKRARAAKPKTAAEKPAPVSAKARTKTAAQKKALSLAMKKAWKKRKAAAVKKA